MKLYFKLIGMHFKSQMQHRTSFITLTVGQALMTVSAVMSVLILMSQSQNNTEFTIMEMLLAGSIVNATFSLAECFFRGFDLFPRLLGNGQYERMLLRPKNILIQILGSTMEFSRLGRTFVALVILIFVLLQVPIQHGWMILLMIFSGIVLFGSLFIIYGACSFYTTDSLEVFNIFTDGGRQFGQIPFNLYGKNILVFATFVIPYACFQYYPLLVVLGKSVSTIYMLAPLASFIFVIPAMLIWKQGMRHYQSTGS